MKTVFLRMVLSAGCAIVLPVLAFGQDPGADAAQSRRVPAVDRFREAYELLVMGDEARDAASVDEAIRLYRDALGLYLALSRQYPDWQPDVTRFRISYCDSQIEVLLRRLEADAMENVGGNGEGPADPSVPDASGEPVTEPPGGPFDEATPTGGDIEKVRSDAKVVLTGDEPGRARLILLKGLESAPDDAGVRLLMGILHCRLGEHTQAMHLMEQLVEEQPSNAVARVVLGSAYFGVGRMEDAETQMKKAIETDAGLAEAHFDLAHILMARSPTNVEAAGLHYRKALDMGCDADPAFERELRKAGPTPADDTWDSPVDPGK